MARKHLFVLGPSGVGKSSLGHWLEDDIALLHLEHDIYPESGDGMDALGLRAEWNAFHDCGDPSALVNLLESRAAATGKTGTVVTFSGVVVLRPDVLRRAEVAGIATVVLYGSGSACVNSFLAREKTTAQNLGFEHWVLNNQSCYIALSSPEFAPWRVDAFVGEVHRNRADLVNAVRGRLAG
jgi:hypothetical protein